MARQLFGAVVVILAGTCWMVAQYAVGQPAVAPISTNPSTRLIDDRSLPPLTVGTASSSSPNPAATFPGELPMAAIPAAPPQQEAVRSQAATTTAIPGLPALPSVPGVAQAPPPVFATDAPSTGTSSTNNFGNPTLIKGPGGVSAQVTPGDWTSAPSQTPVWDPNQQPPLYGPQQPLSEEQLRQLGPQLWGRADYLLWFARSSHTPNLVQALGIQNGSTPQTVTNLFPDSKGVSYNPMSGLRGVVGLWFNDLQTLGVESSYFWFGENTQRNSYASGDGYILAHPYFNVANNQSAFDPLSAGSGTQGTSSVRTGFQIEGGDSNLLIGYPVAIGNFSALVGFRYLQMREWLAIDDISQTSSSTLTASDYFSTRNQFFGGQTGLRYAWVGNALSFNLVGKIAYGAMNETVHIDGASTLTNGSGSTSRSGGIYALNSNIGSYNRTTTAFVPELNANVGWRIRSWATATVGYNFMYVSQVVRPGRQVDPNINPDNLPFSGSNSGSTVMRPAFQFHGESFWMQGVNIGINLQY